jgi:hypothetical protein
MTMVRVNGAPPAKSAVAVNKAEIKGQGSIPYAKITTEATPNTAYGQNDLWRKTWHGRSYARWQL